MKKTIHSLLVFALGLSLVLPNTVYGENSKKDKNAGEDVEISGVYHINNIGVFDDDSFDISNSTKDLTAQSPHINNKKAQLYIDRIDFPDYARNFYYSMIEASDNDGKDDWLIDVTQGVKSSNYYLAPVGSFATTSELGQARNYILAAIAAFDRDHPEVFWLSDSYSFAAITENKEFTLYVILSSDGYIDIRDLDSYSSASKIREAIKKRDKNIKKIISGMPKTYVSTYEKVKYFNKWLTTHNAYNSDVAKGIIETVTPEAWECTSALAGQTGKKGPVCEAYARAMMVLCNSVNIPCVLESGTAYTGSGSGGHMWNSIKVGSKWYGTDVTWNDPYVSSKAKKAKSGYENSKFLLVGASTIINRYKFSRSHYTTNQIFRGATRFTNSPKQSSGKMKCKKHKYTYAVSKKATLKKNGKMIKKCKICGKKKKNAVIYKIKKITISSSKFIYDGTTKIPSIKVKDSKGKTVSSKYYSIVIPDESFEVGAYKLTIKFKNRYSGSKTFTYKIVAPSND